MLILLIFLFIILFLIKNKKIESFDDPINLPNLSNLNLKDALHALNQHLIPITVSENSITQFVTSIDYFNYFSYNHSPDITILIPMNSSINQYLNWIFADLNEFNINPNIINNCFILGNLFNKNCIFNNQYDNCGPFTKSMLINKSDGNLQNSDFIIPDIHYKNGIIHIVDFILEGSQNINLLKQNYFIEYDRSERESYLSQISS